MCKAVSSTLIVIVNLLFIPISLCLILIGALVQWNRQMLVDRIVPALLGDIDDPNVRDAANKVTMEILSFLASYGLVVFIFGLFLFLLAFCGVCGVCCKSKILLGTYAALLLVIFLALLVFTIVFGTRISWFRSQMQDAFKVFFVKHYNVDNENPPQDALTVLLNTMQKKNYCCGSYDSSDFLNNESFKKQAYKIPASCCKTNDDRTCWENPTVDNSYMDKGCFHPIWNLIDTYYKYILYAMIGLLVFTFLFAVIAIYLLTRYSRELEYI